MRTSDDARDHPNCPPQQNSRHCICKQALQPLLSKHNFNAIHILPTLNGEFQQQVTLPRSSERPLARATIIQAQDRHRSCKMRAAVLPFRSAILAARPEDPTLTSEPEEFDAKGLRREPDCPSKIMQNLEFQASCKPTCQRAAVSKHPSRPSISKYLLTAQFRATVILRGQGLALYALRVRQ